jgi:tRNA threonylcarbamoyladenosine biosynthesis protein TsaB
MNLLAIETSTDGLGVALVDDTRVLASSELLAERVHATELPGALTNVLKSAGRTLEQIDAFAVDVGPGAFTGLRIGVAFVKALVFRLRRPVIGVASLDVLAAALPYAAHPVCPILDAKQKKIYAACYDTRDGAPRKRSDYQLLTVDAWLSTLPQEPIVLLGSGAALYREAITKALGPRALFAPHDLWLPRAATLGRLGLERLRAGQHDDPSTLVPMYLYPMDCTVRARQS